MELLHHYFEHRAKESPAHLALICNELRLSYRDMDLWSNQAAHFLSAQGIKPGDRIALLMPKIADLYISILAILKVGAAYVPIDPAYPLERVDYMLQDSQARLLLTSLEFAKKLHSVGGSIIYIEHAKAEITQQSYEPIAHNLTNHSSENPCYIIYTSGSTGRPKGVEISHGNVCNYINAAKNIYMVEPKDRVYQGFSVAFDASVEEIWLAFSAGATLVTGISAALHGGASLAEFLNLHEVTVLSTVPTLLAMLEENLTHVRVLILGGEVCSAELVTRWSRPHRRIFNTYGPTETAIVATYHECQPGQTVSIGRPISNCDVFILNEDLQFTSPGQIGELYIGGAGLARGYTDHQLTQEKFVHVPAVNKRLYRTADLAYYLENGEIQYVGRVDDQVKIRGFRVELCEIETLLLRYPNICAATVGLHEIISGVQTLVAYLILRRNAQFNEIELKKFLADQLPDYMIPNLFEVVTSFPLLSTGKVDRKRLPKPQVHCSAINQDYVAPKTATEKILVKAWQNLLHHTPISIRANFFHDLGGHSLLASRLVSELRRNGPTEHLSTLDLYENPTIEQLAAKIEIIQCLTSSSSIKEERIHEVKKTTRRFRWCGFCQLIGLYVPFSMAAWQFLMFFLPFKVIATGNGGGSGKMLLVVTLLLLGLNPILFLLAILSKWVLLGRIKPGDYPLWGWYYFRWWLARSIQALAPIEYLAGSPLMNVYCRLLGAKIGKNCYLGTQLIGSFDLISIGDDSSIGVGSFLTGYLVEKGKLRIGCITVGKRCFVGANTVLSLNTRLEDDSKLDDQSMLIEGSTTLAGLDYCGSPARPSKIAVPAYHPTQQNYFTTLKYAIWHGVALHYILLLYTIAFLPGIALVDYVFFSSGTHWVRDLFFVIPLAALTQTLLLGALISLSKRLILGRVVAGTYSLSSGYYVRKWLVDNLIKLSQTNLGSLYATLYLPFWLRTLGAKIGKRTEISTVDHISPDLLTIEDETFLADGVFLGVPRVFRNSISIAPNKIGKRTFVGNNAFVPQGTELGEACLIGCLSIAPIKEQALQPDAAWFGSPPVFLPKREIFSGFSEKETYNPTKSMYIQRGFFDFLRVIAPAFFLYFILCLQLFSVNYLSQQFSLFVTILLFPIFTIGLLMTIILGIIGLKWILMGRYKNSVNPAWSVFVWRNELLTGLYDFVMAPMLLEGLVGTPFLAFFLRLLGAKIGKQCYIETTFFTEFDLVDIGNQVTLNMGCTIQTHLFEDRVLKMAKLKMMDHCHVGNMAVVLYDTLMGTGASLANLSLLMKGETLPDYSHWLGIPAQSPRRIAAE